MRVSDNTSKGVVGESLRRTRGRMEKLQIQNSTQKRLLAPSDDPSANSKILDIRTQTTVNAQYDSNAALAKTRLSATDSALSELYELFVRAKEISLSQSNGPSANEDSRLGVAQEVSTLYRQLVSIANRRFGQHYLFGGFKTLSEPYTGDGKYKGDQGEIPVEVQKDVFVPINVPGPTVFEFKKFKKGEQGRAPAATDKSYGDKPELLTVTNNNDAAGVPPIDKQNAQPAEVISAFKELDALRVGLLTNDTITVRDGLERLDDIIQNIITIRTKISSRVSGIDNSVAATQKMDLQNAELSTQLEDADYAELWSNIAKEESVLRSSLQAAQKLIQPTLLEFLR